MAEPARSHEDLYSVARGALEAEEKEPSSQERPKTEEEAAVESGDFNKIETVLGGWKTRAIEDIRGASESAIPYVLPEAPDIAVSLQDDQKKAMDELEAATELTRQDASRFLTGREAEAPEPITLVPEMKVEKEEVPEHITAPESEVEYVEMRHQLKNVQKELDALLDIPAADRTEKDNIRRALLVNESSMIKKTLERYEIENDINAKELKLERLDGMMLKLLKQAPANDVESLPPEQKKQAREIQHARAKLETAVQEQRANVAEISAALLGLDRLMTQSKAQLRSLEEAEAAEAAKEAEAVHQEAEERERARKAAELERAAKFEPPKKDSIGAFKRGAGKGLVAVGIGAALSFLSISKVMSWIDKGLKYMFETDVADKMKNILKIPEKILGWIGKKMGIEDEDEKKK